MGYDPIQIKNSLSLWFGRRVVMRSVFKQPRPLLASPGWASGKRFRQQQHVRHISDFVKPFDWIAGDYRDYRCAIGGAIGCYRCGCYPGAIGEVLSVGAIGDTLLNPQSPINTRITP